MFRVTGLGNLERVTQLGNVPDCLLLKLVTLSNWVPGSVNQTLNVPAAALVHVGMFVCVDAFYPQKEADLALVIQ